MLIGIPPRPTPSETKRSCGSPRGKEPTGEPNSSGRCFDLVRCRMKERLRKLLPAPVWAAAASARDWSRKARYLRERWKPPIGTRPPIGLAVCAIFRDEARYLAE